jgi:hypothetical protein
MQFASDCVQASTFRSPAKRYAGAYSIKVALKKDLVEYDVPMWIKPDQEKSSLDPTLMKDLGFQDPDFTFSSVKISGQQIGKTKFSKMPSEWAFVPDFAKSCCFGVIGQDILSRFEVRFDPGSPVHLEWKKLGEGSKALAFSGAFKNKLKDLFSLSNTADVPYVLNLREQKLDVQGKPPIKHAQLFTFQFIPPDRDIRIQKVGMKVSRDLIKSGLRPGQVITEINGKAVSRLDRWEVEKFLSGQKANAVTFKTLKGESISYSFE